MRRRDSQPGAVGGQRGPALRDLPAQRVVAQHPTHRLGQRAGIAATARECARAAAQSGSKGEASFNGYYRAGEAAAGYGLTNGTLLATLDLGRFAAGETVSCGVSYTAELSDLPLLGWARVTVSGSGHERLALYRGDRDQRGP